MRKNRRGSKADKDPDLNGLLMELRSDIAVIKQELKMHRWILGMIFSMITAILVKALFF